MIIGISIIIITNSLYLKLKNKSIKKHDKGDTYCMIPFFDSCNTVVSTKSKQIQRFLTSYKSVVNENDKNSSNLEISSEKLFKENEEYNYFYTTNNEFNIGLVQSYGFYVKNNIDKFFVFQFNIDKNYFDKEKHDLCVKLKCFEEIANYDNDYSHFYNESSSTYVITHKVQQFNNNNILNIFRLMFLPKINTTTFNQLQNNIPLSYGNELLSISYFNNYVMNFLESKPTITDILHIKQVSRSNKPKDNDYLLYKYNLREIHLYQPYEEKIIMLKAIKTNMRNILNSIYSNVKNRIFS